MSLKVLKRRESASLRNVIVATKVTHLMTMSLFGPG
jgi:hypothetical protein